MSEFVDINEAFKRRKERRDAAHARDVQFVSDAKSFFVGRVAPMFENIGEVLKMHGHAFDVKTHDEAPSIVLTVYLDTTVPPDDILGSLDDRDEPRILVYADRSARALQIETRGTVGKKKLQILRSAITFDEKARDVIKTRVSDFLKEIAEID